MSFVGPAKTIEILEQQRAAVVSHSEDLRLENIRLHNEIERLEAENERLKTEGARDTEDLGRLRAANELGQKILDTTRAENERLQRLAEDRGQEIERLREECRLAAELQVRTGALADEYLAEIERLRTELRNVLPSAHYYLARLDTDANGIPEEGEAGDRSWWDHYRATEAAIRQAEKACQT